MNPANIIAWYWSFVFSSCIAGGKSSEEEGEDEAAIKMIFHNNSEITNMMLE